MKRFTPFLLALALLVAALSALPAPGVAHAATSNDAIDWLIGQIQPDGGFSDGFSEGSNLSATTEALFAAAALGEDPTAWGVAPTPLDYLAAQAPAATGTGDIAKLILLADAMGRDVTAFGGTDLVAALDGVYDEASGLFSGTVPEHAYAMLARHALGTEIPAEATDALLGLQGEEGGWSFDGVGQPDTNTTALVMQALAAEGTDASSEPMTRALDFLRSQQNPDGGFAYQIPSDFGTESDANSTAWVIQGLLATGQPLDAWGNPEQFLASLQNEDGSFSWKAEVPGANFLATAQAVPAVAGTTLLELPSVALATAPQNAPAAPGNVATDAAETARLLPWLALGAFVVLGLLFGTLAWQRGRRAVPPA